MLSWVASLLAGDSDEARDQECGDDQAAHGQLAPIASDASDRQLTKPTMARPHRAAQNCAATGRSGSRAGGVVVKRRRLRSRANPEGSHGQANVRIRRRRVERKYQSGQAIASLGQARERGRPPA